MNRFILFFLLLFIVICLFLQDFASADYFNGAWFEQRQKDKSNTFGSESGGSAAGVESSGEEGTAVSPFGFKLPKEVSKPVISQSDSIDVEKFRIKRQNEIPGLRVENYYFVPFEDYIRQNVERTNDSLWEKEKKKQMKNWTVDKTGGVTDLDFVIPVGKRFEGIVGGTTNIRIDGQQRIEFAGKSEYDVGVIETATTKNSTFPSLTMKQEPKFSIRGNVGDRITVDIKQDPQAGPLSNVEENISLKYQGEDYDIIKYIEAGNTSLNLKGATFAGYSGSHKGLFGIRSEAQLGPFEITTIASQEKGESNTKSFKGKAEEATTEIKDYNYKSNTYFFLDEFYMSNFARYRDSFDRIYYESADSLKVFEVYINDGIDSNDTKEGTFAYPGIAWPMYMEDRGFDNPDAYVKGYFHRMDPKDYYVNRELGFIQFQNRIPDEWTVGAYMVTQDGDEFGSLKYDAKDPESRNVFKLIKRKGQRPTDTDTWDLEWKNVYDLGQRNIDLDGLEIRIFKQATDGVSRDKQDGVPYIQILGIDKVDEQGNLTPDNKVDFNRGFVDRFRGELIFPLLRPFDSDEPPAGITEELEEKVPEIYDVYNFQEKQEATKYYIEVKTANRQSTIRVGGGFGGILENSEGVYLDGKKLARGTDYRINYMSGEITLLNEDALSPNADIKIDFQEANAFQQMQKTLFGVRAEYDVLPESRIGGVFLYNNESTKEKRVRLGNEPSRTFLFDLDADFNFQSQFLTNAVDLLPLVVASQPSNIRIQGEIARSMPTLNTHKEVTIDDFEGSQNTPMGIMRTNWTPASKPDDSTPWGMKLKKRGRLQWYNPWDRIKSEDIWPNKETTAGENTVHVINLAYGKAEGVADNESFAGVMSAFWGSGIDLSRARFIEVWARGGKGDLKIDIGSISEDYYPVENPNGSLDTEDIPIPGQGHGDGVLTADEDTGLDGIYDKLEPGYSADNRDPNGDNWGYNPNNKNDYSRINGTEGNARDSDISGIPDTEDVNHNGILDTRDSYYEYSISFNDPFDPYLVEDSVPEGNPAGWRLFRIPLWNNLQSIADGTEQKPDSTLIEFGRLWITNTDSTIIQIASIEIVESNWIEQGIFDSEDNDITGDDDTEILRLATKNTHENLDYTSPPGIKGELDRDTKIRRKEQAIVIEVENLDAGHGGFIYRNFETMDFTDYTRLKMYIHGPDEFPVPSEGKSDYELLVRFGGDKANYYEYRTPVYRGWANENMVDVDFEQCTELKLADEYGMNTAELVKALTDSLTVVFTDSLAHSMTDSLAQVVADSLVSSMTDSLTQSVKNTMADALTKTVGIKTYSLKGNPSLNNIKIISVGLKNNQPHGRITSEVWVNELQLDALRNMDGTAYKTDINADLSGFLNFTGNVTKKSSDFHGMNAKKGSGNDDMQWGATVKANLDRFTPKRWNLSLPVSATFGGGEALPRLKSGSDIVLPDDRKKEFRTFREDRKARISYKKGHDQTKKGVTGFVTSWAFEKVSADFDWGENFNISPTRGEASSDNQQLNLGYDVAPKERGFTLLGWMPELPTELGRKISNAQLNYTPSALNYRYNYSQRNNYTTDIDGNEEAPRKIKTSNDTINLTYNPFSVIKYDYSLNRANDLYIKQEVGFTEKNRFMLEGPEMFNITNKYNYDFSYDEDNDPKYSLSSQLGSRTVKFSKSFQATADFALSKFLEEELSGKPKPPRSAETDETNRPTWGSLFKWMKKDRPDEQSNEPEKEEQIRNGDESKENNEPSDDVRNDGVEQKEIPGNTAEDIKPEDITGKKESEGTDEKKKPVPGLKANKPAENQKDTNSEKSKKDANQQKSKKQDGEKTDEKKKGEGIRTKVVMAISRSVSPISFEYREGEQLNYSGLTDRPGFMARIGQEAINPPDTSSVVSSRNTSAITETYSARTSLKLPLDIGIRTSATLERSERITSSVKDKEENATFPEVSLTWAKFGDKIPYFTRIFSNTNLSSAYAISKSKNWQNEIIEPTTDRTDKKFSPLININTKVFKKVDVSFSLNNSRQTNYDISGEVKSLSLVDTKGTSLTLRYSLSPRSLPFFKNSKMRSNINLTADYKTNESTTQRQVGNERIAKIQETRTNSVSVNIDYGFSQKFRGGARMLFSNSEDITKKVHKVSEISVWCEIKF